MTYPLQPLQRLRRWHQQAQYIAQHIPNEVPLPVSGRLTRMVGLTLEAEGLYASLGSRCLISQGRQQSEAEVVGFHRD